MGARMSVRVGGHGCEDECESGHKCDSKMRMGVGLRAQMISRMRITTSTHLA